MKKFLFIIFLLTSYIFLKSCGSVSDAKKVLSNEKIRTNDEFLVKKREPLTLPPDFSEIPRPESLKNEKVIKKSNIETILKVSEEEAGNKKTSKVEQAIINEIGN